jgi:hypothetical protein
MAPPLNRASHAQTRCGEFGQLFGKPAAEFILQLIC